MNFVTWSIRNPVPVIVLFIALTVAGLISFPKLGVLDRPDIEFPAVVVTVTYPGVAPTQMESEITRKVEDAVATIAGIEQMTSTVDESTSTTSIEFRFGTDLSAALDDVRECGGVAVEGDAGVFGGDLDGGLAFGRVDLAFGDNDGGAGLAEADAAGDEIGFLRQAKAVAFDEDDAAGAD